MKKSGVWFTIFTLVFVLGASYLCSEYVIPFFKERYTYSETTCVTKSLTSDMDEYEKAQKYSDAGAVARIVICYGNTAVSHGSGVCVASNGYETTTLTTSYTAQKGSYYATNYHVIESLVTSNSYSVKVQVEEKDDNGDVTYPAYSAKLVWQNKDLDVAIVYTERNFNYVSMRDNWIDYGANGRQREGVFVVGTPLTTDNFNRVTIGGIASTYGLCANTLKTVNGTKMLDNYYEDGMDLSADIAPGNSGGGVFDKKGNLIGLATFTISYEDGGVSAFNGATSIYPVMKALDKVIVNNETHAGNTVYDLEALGIRGYDANEVYAMQAIESTYHTGTYYLDNHAYTSVSFADYGYYVYSSNCGLSHGDVIKNVTLKRGENVVADEEILDRNDLIYILLKANVGDKLVITLDGTSTIEITLS